MLTVAVDPLVDPSTPDTSASIGHRVTAPPEEDRKAFAREWHSELREEIRAAQDRRETVLRWSLPVIFAAVASKTATDSNAASDALWRWLAAGVVLMISVETTFRLTRDIVYAGARNERLEKFEASIAPVERSVHEPARERWENLRLPARLRPYWPRPGRSRLLAGWYALAGVGVIGYWFVGVSGASWEQTLAAVWLPILALVGCLRLLLRGRLHFHREELLAGDRLLGWVEDGRQPDDPSWSAQDGVD